MVSWSSIVRAPSTAPPRMGVILAGAVFKVIPAGTETVLHSFAGGTDGCVPRAGLMRAGTKLYGTTSGCGGSKPAGESAAVRFQLMGPFSSHIGHQFHMMGPLFITLSCSL